MNTIDLSSLISVGTWNTATLTDASLKVAIVFAVAALLCRLMHRQSAALRHHVWVMTLFSALVVPLAVATLPAIRFNLLPAPPTQVAPASTWVDPARDEDDSGAGNLGFPIATAANDGRNFDDNADAAVAAGLIPVPMGTVVAGGSDSATENSGTWKPANEAATTRIAVSLVSVWMIGAIAALTPFLLVVFTQSYRHRRCSRVADPDINGCVVDLARQIGLRRRIVLYESATRDVPAVFGWLRPYVVLPINWRQWNRQQTECILLHELAHIKRHDLASQLLGRIVVALYWFNPLAWYAIGRMRVEREQACDDCVLSTGRRPSDYAQQLIETLKTCRIAVFSSGLAMAHRGRLDERIHALLDDTVCRRPVRSTVACMTLLVATLLSLTIGAGTLHSSGSETPVERAAEEASEAETPTLVTATVESHEEASDPLMFSGQVLHGEKPVAGVSISLYERIGHWAFYEEWHPREEIDVAPRVVAISDQDGNFQFTFSPELLNDTPWTIWPDSWKQVQVVASKDAMGVGWCNLGQLESRGKIWIRGTVPLRGRVIDIEGQPVADAAVNFHYLSDDQPTHSELWQPTWTGLSSDVKTNSEGEFEIRGLPTNRKGVHLYVDGRRIATKRVSIDMTGEERSIELIVEPTKPIQGIVRDIQSGSPVPGITVYGEEENTHRLVRAVTDANGRYELTGLPKSKLYQLTTRPRFSSGYLVRYTTAIDTPGLDPISHDIAIRKGVPVELTLVDKKSRQLLHPEVHYAPTDDNPLHRESSRGNYKPGDGFRQFYSADETGIVRFNAYPGRGLIRVTLQGQSDYPLVGSTDEIRKNALIDINFHFAELSHAYTVIDPKPDEPLVKLELEADPGETMQGNLIDQSGVPVNGATFTNMNDFGYDDREAGGGMSGLGEESAPPAGYSENLGGKLADDQFTVRMLRPGRDRLLVFVHEDRKLIASAVTRLGESLDTVVMTSWATVTGVVKDSNGQPLSDVDVFVDYPQHPKGRYGVWTKRPATKTDSSGAFRLERLIPDLQHKLTVIAPDGYAAIESIEILPEIGQTIDAGELKLSTVDSK
ncbi:MAG: carboxypeptidase regulatory-like domain-containing protein [Planctomycetales bacterium]|nr:carboxypeptidase regulatory-like domain-containing protein [Planctomycetales bacterium]